MSARNRLRAAAARVRRNLALVRDFNAADDAGVSVHEYRRRKGAEARAAYEAANPPPYYPPSVAVSGGDPTLYFPRPSLKPLRGLLVRKGGVDDRVGCGPHCICRL
jgi:hypothetical protein